jgi:hypothetical protein
VSLLKSVSRDASRPNQEHHSRPPLWGASTPCKLKLI